VLDLCRAQRVDFILALTTSRSRWARKSA